MILQDRMTANGNSPLDSMRTLEHYLTDIMRAGAVDTPEHVKGECDDFLMSRMAIGTNYEAKRIIQCNLRANSRQLAGGNNALKCRVSTLANWECPGGIS